MRPYIRLMDRIHKKNRRRDSLEGSLRLWKY